MPAPSLERLAWITGGSTGIGLAVARSLADAGYRVVISARNEPGLRDACRELTEAGAKADYVVADVGAQAQVAQACRTILDRHGRIDVLVNNAGFNVKARQWSDLIPAEFDAVIAANLSGTFYATHAVLPAMRAQGGGTIVNVASVAGRQVAVGAGVAYTVAKHGVVALTETVNLAEFQNGVRACVVCPGGVATRAHAARSQEERDVMLRPEDVAQAVRYAVEAPAHAAVYAVDILPIKRW